MHQACSQAKRAARHTHTHTCCWCHKPAPGAIISATHDASPQLFNDLFQNCWTSPQAMHTDLGLNISLLLPCSTGKIHSAHLVTHQSPLPFLDPHCSSSVLATRSMRLPHRVVFGCLTLPPILFTLTGLPGFPSKTGSPQNLLNCGICTCNISYVALDTFNLSRIAFAWLKLATLLPLLYRLSFAPFFFSCDTLRYFPVLQRTHAQMLQILCFKKWTNESCTRS